MYVLFSYLVLFLGAGQNLISYRIGDPDDAHQFNIISGITIGAVYLAWNLLALFIYLARVFDWVSIGFLKPGAAASEKIERRIPDLSEIWAPEDPVYAGLKRDVASVGNLNKTRAQTIPKLSEIGSMDLNSTQAHLMSPEATSRDETRADNDDVP